MLSPTIFDIPPHLLKETNPRKGPTKSKATSEVPDVSKKRPRTNFQPISHEHNYCTSPGKVIPRMKKSREDKRKKIKSLSIKRLGREKTIKGLLKRLQDLKHLSKEQSRNLKSNFGHRTKELFINQQKNALALQ